MPARRAFLREVPGDPCSDYLKATLPLADRPETADALVVPRLTEETAGALLDALRLGKPALLPAEALPDVLSSALRSGLSQLTQCGLIVCPLTELPRWVLSGTGCPLLLTYGRLKELAERGFDRVYLAARPAATPLALAAAKAWNIRLTGGICPGTGQSDRFGMVHQKK